MIKNFQKVFAIFEKYYQPVPLEVFGKHPYKTLISTIMSARTKDETTLAASKRLFSKAPNPKALSELSVGEIKRLIYPVGFYKTKAKYLKATAAKLLRSFDGKVPKTKQGLLKLPGVGRKTANLVMNRAFGIPAIAVDTHVHRITNMLGWVKTNSPEATERALTKTVPRKYWSKMNKLFVSIGRQHGTKKGLENFLKKSRLV